MRSTPEPLVISMRIVGPDILSYPKRAHCNAAETAIAPTCPKGVRASAQSKVWKWPCAGSEWDGYGRLSGAARGESLGDEEGSKGNG